MSVIAIYGCAHGANLFTSRPIVRQPQNIYRKVGYYKIDNYMRILSYLGIFTKGAWRNSEES